MASPIDRRCRRPPILMEEYETGQGFSKGNTKVNLAISDSDPTLFDTTAQITKGRKAMDEEMASINKNGT